MKMDTSLSGPPPQHCMVADSIQNGPSPEPTSQLKVTEVQKYGFPHTHILCNVTDTVVTRGIETSPCHVTEFQKHGLPHTHTLCNVTSTVATGGVESSAYDVTEFQKRGCQHGHILII